MGRIARGAVDMTADKAVDRTIKDQYTENLFELIPVARKVDPVYMMEILMRADQGKPISRPLGSHKRLELSPWDKLMFNPVHLFRFPTMGSTAISTSVTIGRGAKKPLHLSIPIMIAGMSFGGALSKTAKIALAKGASMIGTASNTGEAGLLREERAAANLLIGQYNRGGWLNSKEKYSEMDAIEIQLGQGAQGSAPQKTAHKNIGEEYRNVLELGPDQDAVIGSRLPGVDTKVEFISLVNQLKVETGVPVGLKIAATHHLEKELQIALEAGVDFITLDGAEGGTHGSSPTTEDDLGLPTLYAISRASKFLASKGMEQGVSLIAAGGIITPGDCLKAMALGADAVYMGTAVVLALIGDQMTKALPFEPPTDLVVYNAKMTDSLDVNKSANNLYNFLKASVMEMQQVCYSLGKSGLSEVDRQDLCALDPHISRAVGVELGFISPGEQSQYFAEHMDLPFISAEGDEPLDHDQPLPKH